MAWKFSRAGGVPVTRHVRKAIDRADAARDSRSWTEAAQIYDEVLAADPGLTAIWVQKGHMAYEAGDTATALIAYGRAAALNPDDGDAVFHLSRLNHDLGNLDPVGDALQAAIVEPAGSPRLPAGMTLEQAQELIDSMRWHHSIDFGDGLVAKAQASADFIKLTGAALFQGLDLAGRSLLDIGAWNGAYSVDAKRRGADRVLATDHFCWRPDTFDGRRTFDLTVQLTGLDIEARDIDVPEITPQSVGRFDAVLFSGVFYHLLEPVHLTRRISECADHLLILETVHDALDCPRPSMIFYPGTTHNNDPTNWWGPNPHCLYEMLREFGFAEIHYRDAPRMGRARGIYHAYRSRESMAKFGVERPAPGWLSLSDSQARAELFAPIAC